MALQVELVVPEGEVWSGPASLVIAKTMEGDIGVLAGHAPVLGILVEGSVVRIMPRYGSAGQGGEDQGAQAQASPGRETADEVIAAISGGFFSVADDRVSILARQARLGIEVDLAATRSALEEATAAAEGPDGEETAEARYLRALLRAAGDTAGTS
jgi:F-type H+-transporting ATPase subunit epsilon